MGYHTWVAKKLQALTEKEKEDKIKEALSSAKSCCRYESFEDYKETMVQFYKEYIEAYREQMESDNIDEKSRKIYDYWVKCATDDAELRKDYEKYERRTRKNLDALSVGGEEAFQYAVKKMTYPDKVKNGVETYISIDFDNPFRVRSGSSDRKITNKDELLKYLSKCGELVEYYDFDSGQYFDGYTPELEKKVNDYFALHGEDNLLFHFG